MLLDEFVPIPLGPELLADSNRHLHLSAKGSIDAGIFTAYQVLDEVGTQRLDSIGEMNGIGHIELRVEIDAPRPVLAGSFPDLAAVLVGSVDRFEAVAAR
jgi:hypothetical protein